VLDPGQRLLRVGLPVEGLVLLDRLAVRATAMRPQSSTALPTVETPDVLDLPGLFLVTGPERIAGSSASRNAGPDSRAAFRLSRDKPASMDYGSGGRDEPEGTLLGSGFRIQDLEHIPAYPPMPYAGAGPDLLHDALRPEPAQKVGSAGLAHIQAVHYMPDGENRVSKQQVND
jgi:hypothetical protein